MHVSSRHHSINPPFRGAFRSAGNTQPQHARGSSSSGSASTHSSNGSNGIYDRVPTFSSEYSTPSQLQKPPSHYQKLSANSHYVSART
jgi:hypothetical protein